MKIDLILFYASKSERNTEMEKQNLKKALPVV